MYIRETKILKVYSNLKITRNGYGKYKYSKGERTII